MTVLSNLYVEKVNSEHPLAVWMLNEQVDYISHITEVQREIEDALAWTLTNCTASNEVPPYGVPMSNTHVSRISGSVPSGSPIDIEAVSIFEINPANFTASEGNFALGFHIYIDSSVSYANSISFGYQYLDTNTSTIEEIIVTKDISTLSSQSWHFFTNTFAIPEAYMDNIKILIRFNVLSGGVSGEYDFLINGLSLGQWSEEFNGYSLGIEAPLQSMPSDISLPSSLEVIEALSYGNSEKAYYVANGYEIFCKNFGIPLTYGSLNVTKLYPNIVSTVTYPSLIFPGYGFLNQKGKYNEYTAEMWIRVNTDAIDPRKIFGPISSSDGLYVEGGFLTLVFGKKYASHYVGEWYRPMLIHIKYIKDNISMFVNGEEVASIDYSDSDILFPNEFDGSSKSQDWLGFYSYDDVHPISIDSFAIYSYSIPKEVAKRKWVWGQAVIAPEVTNSSLNATTVFNDYSFAKYAVNYNYPDFASWRQAFFENIRTSSNFISLPDYKKPDIFIGDGTSELDWYDSLQTEQSAISEKYYSFRPSISNSYQCYLYYKNLDVIDSQIKSIYGLFNSDGTATNHPLIKIINFATKDYFLIKINGTSVTYSISINGNLETISTKTIVANQNFSVGIDIDEISSLDIEGIKGFFSNQSLLSMYALGDGTTTFSGKTYRLGFNGPYNHRKVSSLFTDGVLNIDSTTAQDILDHVGDYTLKAYEKYSTFFLDIAVSGYWEDYMPLSYFAKYVKDYSNDLFYDLDFMQINFDYPEPLEIDAVETVSSWTYSDLFSRYSSPVQLSYSDLQNFLYTGWEDYQDMSEDSEKYFYYENQRSSVKCYVSFQKISNGANKNLVDFQYKTVARAKGVVDPNLLTDIDPVDGVIPTNWENKAFEVVDGTIVYPPLTYNNSKPVNFNDIAIVYHLDFKSDGIIHHPVKFRELQIASQVLERKTFTEVGTKFGTPIYPYVKNGFYYDFKAKNPVGIYKGSTPHLYTNRHSGWKIKGDLSPIIERGVSISVNSEKVLGVEISSIQIWGRFSEKYFPQSEIPIVSIDHKNDIYDIYLVSDESTQRGKIFAKSRLTSLELSDITYHINGQTVGTPFIINEEWFVLGIAFTSGINFDAYSGTINLNGPLIYNNISYYLTTGLEKEQKVETRSWSQVDDQTWTYWKDSFTWSEVKVISTTNSYSIDPTQIYEKYVGADRIIVDDNISGMMINPEKIKIYGDISWSSTTKIPV